MLERFKGFNLKWYHLVVFWLPGGMFLLAGLLAYQYRNTKIVND